MSWRPAEESPPGQSVQDLAPDLARSFFLALQDRLGWEEQALATDVVLGSQDIFSPEGDGSRFGRHLRQTERGSPSVQATEAQWDNFTLGVWTTADGSLGDVSAVQNCEVQIIVLHPKLCKLLHFVKTDLLSR